MNAGDENFVKFRALMAQAASSDEWRRLAAAMFLGEGLTPDTMRRMRGGNSRIADAMDAGLREEAQVRQELKESEIRQRFTG